MGQTLSEPVIEKHSTEDGDDRLIYAASSMQGWRVSMEDAHTTILKLDGSNVAFFAVYDGHGGKYQKWGFCMSKTLRQAGSLDTIAYPWGASFLIGQNVAKYSGNQLHKRIAAEDAFKEGKYHVAIKNGFLGTDADLKQDPEFAHDPSGCTAVAAIIEPGKRVLVGNAGDSRAVISVNGKVEALSHDHKPVNKAESQRIVAAGGFVEFGRVNGNLALSRAIGDFEFKQNFNLSPEHQIVTCIWDCMTSQEVVDFVRVGIADKKSLKVICEELMDRCLAPDSEIGGIGCDNMTVVIVGLLNNLTKQQWYDNITKKLLQSSATDRLGNFLTDSNRELGSKHVTGNGITSTSGDLSDAVDGEKGDSKSALRDTVQNLVSADGVDSKDSTVSVPIILPHTSNSITTTDG
ncbi:phosphatase 2C-like domain-containing protein [Jimgerdemannia flammicorona]|uniref:protein-serine/threonine phosphatase n=1 Tax=Jimgerdemannia flammicorona TaxID=994334 RepID=A0A433R0K9_9FUNG|nr:phosphatase 2C-like domain-containing protein [Jimgerdemannia flammicorona]